MPRLFWTPTFSSHTVCLNSVPSPLHLLVFVRVCNVNSSKKLLQHTILAIICYFMALIWLLLSPRFDFDFSPPFFVCILFMSFVFDFMMSIWELAANLRIWRVCICVGSFCCYAVLCRLLYFFVVVLYSAGVIALSHFLCPLACGCRLPFTSCTSALPLLL